jgi:ATP-dependent DNA ligase
MLKFVKSHGLEAVVAKRADSVYQPGLRTGLWSKYRINLGQEFVIGGYIPSHLGFDSIAVVFYRGNDLYYPARIQAGFVPATRRLAFDAIKHPEDKTVSLREPPRGRARAMGPGIYSRKDEGGSVGQAASCRSDRVLEWTGANHLRHTKFVGLRDDKDPRKVMREA